MIEARNLVEKIIELNLGDPSVNKTMLKSTNEYVDHNDFKKKMANASSAEIFSLLKGMQERVQSTQSYITETFKDPLNTNTELQKLLGPLDEKIADFLKEIKSCEVLGKYSGILSPKNLLITSGSFYENLFRVLYKKQMDLIIENLGKYKETLIQLVKLKGSSESLH